MEGKVRIYKLKKFKRINNQLKCMGPGLARWLLRRPDNLSSVSGTHMMVGQNYQKLFPHLHTSDCVPTHIYTRVYMCTQNSQISVKKKE